jgi:hypothetical protein
MEWTAQFDGYCERVDLSYWSEPVNALTNLAFLIAALVMWPRVRGLPLARALCLVLAAIGVGSYLFHTHATVWAVTADVVPIVIFIMLYFFVALFHIANLPLLWSLVGTALFIPYAAGLIPLFNALPFFEISAGYWPVPLLILGFAFAIRNRTKSTAIGLTLGAGILCLSLVARSLDELICASLPLGSHYLWHLLNGLMLGWMIEVYRRHMVATGAADS